MSAAEAAYGLAMEHLVKLAAEVESPADEDRFVRRCKFLHFAARFLCRPAPPESTPDGLEDIGRLLTRSANADASEGPQNASQGIEDFE